MITCVFRGSSPRSPEPYVNTVWRTVNRTWQIRKYLDRDRSREDLFRDIRRCDSRAFNPLSARDNRRGDISGGFPLFSSYSKGPASDVEFRGEDLSIDSAVDRGHEYVRRDLSRFFRDNHVHAF